MFRVSTAELSATNGNSFGFLGLGGLGVASSLPRPVNAYVLTELLWAAFYSIVESGTHISLPQLGPGRFSLSSSSNRMLKAGSLEKNALEAGSDRHLQYGGFVTGFIHITLASPTFIHPLGTHLLVQMSFLEVES